MMVGVLKLVFHIPHARSLKDKRAVVRKFRDRVRSHFDVSIAEVDAQDLHQKAVFGVAVISSEAKVCDSVLEEIARVAGLQENALLTDRATELIPIGDELYNRDDFSEDESW